MFEADMQPDSGGAFGFATLFNPVGVYQPVSGVQRKTRHQIGGANVGTKVI
jgi:hypothetical protein